jgi:hypothetical protein
MGSVPVKQKQGDIAMLSVLPEAGKKASKEDIETAFSGPAVLANRIVVTPNPGGVRIAFAEQPPVEGAPVFRAAVSLSFQDAISLYRVVRESVKQPEAALERAAQERSASVPPKVARGN